MSFSSPKIGRYFKNRNRSRDHIELEELSGSSDKTNTTYCQRRSQTKPHKLSKQMSNSTTNTSKDTEAIYDDLDGESTLDVVPADEINDDYEDIDNVSTVQHDAPPLPISPRPIFKFHHYENLNPNLGAKYMSRGQPDALASTSSLYAATSLENPSRVGYEKIRIIGFIHVLTNINSSAALLVIK